MRDLAPKPAQRRLLVVKTSSMGDLVHTLSALEEAVRQCPGLVVDWVCEESFSDIPKLSASVERVIPVAIRRWRKNWLGSETRADIRRFVHELRAVNYDVVIDAQGLIKSAWIAAAARCPSGQRWGLDWSSSREPLASLVVRGKVHAPPQWHAIERLRQLFAAALGYISSGPISCVASAANDSRDDSESPMPAVLLLHGTSRIEKSWPVTAWIALGQKMVGSGYRVEIPWASEDEHQQAQQIAAAIGAQARVLPKMSIGELAALMRRSSGAFGVDSGLMHLSVALGRPTVAIMSAAHLPKFSATRFAPFWATHARVVERASHEQSITVDDVFLAWRQLVHE